MSYGKSEYHMGTEIEIDIFESLSQTLEWDVSECFQLFETLEQEFSRFREDSILSRLNREKTLKVSDTFLEVLQKSQYFFVLSGWFFNPLVDISSLGYTQDFDTLEEDIQEKNSESGRDFQNISIIENTITLKENHILDLGWIVKGYSVDRVKELLRDKWYRNFLINAGGDIYMSGTVDAGEPCTVGIDNPFDITQLAACYDISDVGTATSGTYKRKWKTHKKEHHHIVNPYSWENTDDIVSITLISEDVITSDALATAGIAMGKEKAYIFFEKYHIPALFITKEKKIIITPDWNRYNLEILFP